MNLTVTGLHVDVTAALRTHVEKRFERLVKHEARIDHANVVLTLEKDTHLVRGYVHAGSATFFAEDRGENMYAQIDAVAQKLDRQLRHHRSRETDHHRESGGLHPHEYE